MIVDPLGSLITWAATYGVAGLFLVAALERLMPVVPSSGLLVAIGIGAAEGSWPIAAALLVTAAGSLAGCGLYYACAAMLGEARFIAIFTKFARLFGASPRRMEGLIAYFRNHQSALSFTAQLVPTVRLIAPGIAGLLRADGTSFAVATTIGVLLWNSLFLGVGYTASILALTANASALALKILVVLIVTEGFALILWRRLRRSEETLSKSRRPALRDGRTPS